MSRTTKMKVVNILKVVVVMVLAVTKGEDERSSDLAEVTSTVPGIYSTETSFGNVTNSPLDNGMVIKDIRDNNEVYNTNINLEDKVKELDVRPSTISVVFPDAHHKSASQQSVQSFDYEGVRSPLNHRNKYQEPYKVHEEPNNMKPIKFEENSLKTLLIPSTYDKKQKDDIKVGQTQFFVQPFPYAFEGSHNVGKWLETSQNLHLEPQIEGYESSYQEIGVPYAYYSSYGSQDYNVDVHPHENHYNQAVTKDSSHKTSWKKIAQIVTALVPFGLLLATLTPSIFTIDATSPPATRLRSENPAKSKFKQNVLNLLKANGVEPPSEHQCEDKALCELARKGTHPLANTIERGIWLLANKIPTDVAEKAGMNQLFHAIKTGQCDIFECETPEKVEGRGRVVKRIIRKKKLLNPINQPSTT